MDSTRNKPIILTNTVTGEITTFPSMQKAAEFLNVSVTTVRNYLDNNSSYNEYALSLVKVEDKNIKKLSSKPQSIMLTSTNDSNIVKEFPTIKDAAEFLGVNRSSLNYILNNYNKVESELSVVNGYIVSRTEKSVNYIRPDSIAIEVKDIESNTINIYNSITLAAEAIGVNKGSIVMYFKSKQTRPFKNKYILKKLS